MAILRVCCCCYSVRRGSYVSAVYTIIYFFLFALLTINYLYHEIYNRQPDDHHSHEGASASLTSPTGESILRNSTNNSGVTSTFIINSTVHGYSEYSEKSTGDLIIILVDLTSELCGFAASFLLICGLQQEKKAYLVPWLILVPLHTAIDIVSFLNIIISDVSQAQKEHHDFEWWAFVIILFVLLDLTFNLINVYVFLCVFSQYQEYQAGRGTAAYEALLSSLTVHYHSESGGQGVVATRNSIPKASLNSNERQSNLDVRTNGTGNPCFNDIEKFDIWCEDLVLDKFDQTAEDRRTSGHLLPKMLNNGQSKNRSGSTPTVRFLDGDSSSTSAYDSSRLNSDGNTCGNKKKSFGGRLAPLGTRKHSSGNDCDAFFGGDTKLGTSVNKASPTSGRSTDELSTTTLATFDSFDN